MMAMRRQQVTQASRQVPQLQTTTGSCAQTPPASIRAPRHSSPVVELPLQLAMLHPPQILVRLPDMAQRFSGPYVRQDCSAPSMRAKVAGGKYLTPLG